jgi:predicted HTH transcriptional regulator
LKNGIYTNAAAVLFGKDFFYYHNCIIRLARFRGIDKREFIDNQQIEGNIFDLLNEVTPFFMKHLSVTSRVEGMYRTNELEVPISALRECCANALAHMDWRKTASVGIAIYDDRIEIENAGMLPEEIPAAQLTYGSRILESHTSEPPNEIIARVMYYSGVIEHWGRGLSMIFEDCNRAGLPQPTVTDERGVVRVTFMRPNLSGQKVDPINDPINDPIKLLSKIEKDVFHIVKGYPGISRVNIVPIIGKSEATVKRALKTLCEMGFIEYRGSNKTGGYFSL